MDGGDDSNLVIKKRFVSEAELDERCKRRQEEWEKFENLKIQNNAQSRFMTLGPCMKGYRNRKTGSSRSMKNSSNSNHGKRLRRR